MKRMLTTVVTVALVALVAGGAYAFMGPMASGMGRMGSPMMMGGGMTGGPMMGPGAGAAGCPGMATTGASPTQVTEERAKELAQQYADKYLKGFTVEKVLPFTMGHGTGYSVELKGPQDEMRTFHVNPWGNVMPFGPPGRRTG
jgi:hypothetical protein